MISVEGIFLQTPSSEILEYDIAIIGAGPAGLSAALYAARSNLKVVVLAGKDPPALASAHLIQNFAGVGSISGPELLAKMRKQVEELGVPIINEDANSLVLAMTPKGITTRTRVIMARAVILATGRKSRKLNVKNENELLGHGLSYCALCDGPLYKQKNVVIVGDDEEAIEDALTLAQMGCYVTIVFEKGVGDIDAKRMAELKDPSHFIKIYERAKVTEILQDEKGNVASVVITTGDKSVQTLNARAVFLISHVSTGSLLKQAGIELSEKGCILTNAKQETNIEGVYAAGDVTCGEQQVAVAVGQGAIAGIEASKHVRNLARK